MPDVPLNVVVGISSGNVAQEVKDVLNLQKTGITIPVSITASSLSGLSQQITNIRQQKLFDVPGIQKDIQTISQGLDQLRQKAAQINFGGTTGGGSNVANSQTIASLTQMVTLFNQLNASAAAAARSIQTVNGATNGVANRALKKDIDLNSLVGAPGNSAALDQFLTQAAQRQSTIAASPRFQATSLVDDQAAINKIVAQFQKQTFTREFLPGVLGIGTREGARRREANNLADDKNIPGLRVALQDAITQQIGGNKLPSLFSPQNLLNPLTAAQVARGGIFGGSAAFAAGAIGGATPFGTAGAALAAQAVQAVQHLLDPVKQALEEKTEEYRQSGQALAQSILSLQSVFQANTVISDVNGRQTGNVGAQLRLQERSAIETQTAARGVLLPLGIGGQTEATFVRGVTSALAQRGIVADANQTAQISRALAGVIQTQRPQLLDNPALLNRDLQDVLSGLPQARRTVLGSLLRDVLPDLSKANSGEDVVKALSSKQIFADTQGQSQNIVAVQARLQGARESLNTTAGSALLEAQKPALQFETDIANTGLIRQANEDFGALSGAVQGANQEFQALANLGVAGIFESIVIPAKAVGVFFQTLSQSSGVTSVVANQKAQEDLVDKFQAAQRSVAPRVQIENALAGAGIKDAFDKFTTSTQQSPENAIAQIQRVQDRLGTTEEFKSHSTGLFSILGDEIGKRDAEQSKIFGDTDIGKFSRNRVQLEQTIPAQLVAAQNEAKSAFAGLDRVLAKTSASQDDAKKSQDELNKLQREKDEADAAFRRVARSTTQVAAPGGAIDENTNIFFRRTVQLGARGGPSLRPDTTTEFSPEYLAASGRLRDASGRLAEAKLSQEAKENPAELLQAITQSVNAENKILELRQKGLQLTQEQNQFEERRIQSIQRSFDTNTGAGARAETAQSVPLLSALLSNRAGISGTLDQSGNTILEQQKKLTAVAARITDPSGQRAIKAEQDKLTIALDQVNLQRGFADVDTRDTANSLSEARLRQGRAGQAPIISREAGVDRATIRGQGLFAQLEQDRLERENQNISNELARQQAVLNSPKSSEAERQVALERQETLGRQRSSNEAQIPQLQVQQRLTGPRLEEASASTALALKELQATYDTEKNKRGELSISLEQSKRALDNFGLSLEEQRAGKEENIVNLADAVQRAGGSNPLGNLTEQDRQAVRLNSATAKFNVASQELGLGNRAFGGISLGFASTNNNSDFALGAQKQRLGLENNLLSASKEVDGFAASLQKARAILEQQIIKGQGTDLGAAEPGNSSSPSGAVKTTPQGQGKIFGPPSALKKPPQIFGPPTSLKATDGFYISPEGNEAGLPGLTGEQGTFGDVSSNIAAIQARTSLAAQFAATSSGTGSTPIKSNFVPSLGNRELASDLFSATTSPENRTIPSSVQRQDNGFGQLRDVISELGGALTKFASEVPASIAAAAENGSMAGVQKGLTQ